jgi:hypothetical protein
LPSRYRGSLFPEFQQIVYAQTNTAWSAAGAWKIFCGTAEQRVVSGAGASEQMTSHRYAFYGWNRN